MRKLIIILLFTCGMGQDIAGGYQLTGLYIIHQSIARYDTPIQVSDDYNLGLTIQIGQIEAGEIYKTTYQGPYGHLYAEAIGLVLNVNFYEDGTGVIADSYYPVEVLDFNDCTTDINILPITDDLIYSSDLAAGNIIPSANIIGSVPDGIHDHLTEGFVNGSTSIFAGQPAGSIGISQADFLDHFPSTPVRPTLCDNDNNCFKVKLENGNTIAAGDPLPGYAAGYVIKDPPSSIATNGAYNDTNDCADLYIEWHAIDGALSGSGLGDIIGEDEDGDGTDFDRIWAIEELTVTHMKLSCGYGHPIFGDVLAEFPDCAEYLEEGNDGFVWDAAFANWGGFLTFNAVMYTNTPDPQYFANDSDHDYNGTDGRLVMQFESTCIQDINVRNISLEFIKVDGESCLCPDLGDLNGDTMWNVLDIVTLANCVLAVNCASLENACAGDLDGTGDYNILDIVILANCVLAQNCSDI